MAKKKICLMGRIYREGACDGQTIKTLEIYDELVRRYGENNVGYLNYYGIRISKPKSKKPPEISSHFSFFYDYFFFLVGFTCFSSVFLVYPAPKHRIILRHDH